MCACYVSKHLFVLYKMMDIISDEIHVLKVVIHTSTKGGIMCSEGLQYGFHYPLT